MPDPSDEQSRYLNNASATSLLLACPGSGKTKTGVRRFLHRCAAVDPRGVVYLSFTNVAVEEAQRRARASNAILFGYPNIVSTLDAFFRAYIFAPFIGSELQADVPEPRIVDDLEPLPKDLTADNALKLWDLADYPIPCWNVKSVRRGNESIAFKALLGYNRWLDIPDQRASEVATMKRKLLLRGFATYNDLTMWCAVICASATLRVPEILASRFRELIVDEAQDTSALQQYVLERLQRGGVQVSYIGDPEQCVYQFNDANPQYLAALKAAGGRDVWSLKTNYRATDKLVEVVNTHFGVSMEADRICQHLSRGAFTFVGDVATAIDRFEAQIRKAELPEDDSATIVKANDTLRTISGGTDTGDLAAGVRFAIEAWQSERAGRFSVAAAEARKFLGATISGANVRDGRRSEWKELGWSFIREWFPEPGAESCSQWIERLRSAVRDFAGAYGLQPVSLLNTVLQKKGLPDGNARQFLVRQPPNTRASTIHGVKGESISSVLVWGSLRDHAQWLSLQNSEAKSVIYVAFTRASDLLMVGCPNPQIAKQWQKRGFKPLPDAGAQTQFDARSVRAHGLEPETAKQIV
jgi:hypothetical protein